MQIRPDTECSYLELPNLAECNRMFYHVNSNCVFQLLIIFDNFILEMDGSGNSPLKFHVVMVDNRTFYASVIGKNKTLQSVNFFQSQPYDDTGALYYVVVVLCIYAFSIILMIGSVIKKSKHDNGVTKYMKGMDKIRRMERREQKFKIRVAVLGRTNSRRTAKIKLCPESVSKDNVNIKNKVEMVELVEKNKVTLSDESRCAMQNQSNRKEKIIDPNIVDKIEEINIDMENECNQCTSSQHSCDDAEGSARVTLSSIRMDTLPEVDEDVVSV